jgi:hypothetical protein
MDLRSRIRIMQVRLCITDKRFEEEAKNAWRQLLEAVAPVAFEYFDSPPVTAEQAQHGMPPGATANAALVPPRHRLPGYTNICLSDAFFARNRWGRNAILLHEAVHVRFYLGRLCENYRIIGDQPRVCNLMQGFELDRLNLSEELLTFVQEVGVDTFIAGLTLPPQLAAAYWDERAGFFTNGEAYPYDDNRSPSLAIYRRFYRLLRTELGLAVLQDTALRKRLEELQHRYSAQLRDSAGDDLPWFDGVQRRLLCVMVDTEAPDTDSYRELFDRVRSLPLPN